MTLKRSAIRLFFVVALSAVSAAAFAATVPLTTASPSESLHYPGLMNDRAGKPMNGTLQMVFHYRDAVTGQEILVETHKSVRVTHGTFEVELGQGMLQDGQGEGRYTSLAKVLHDFPDFYIEVEANRTLYQPWIRVASAGHSPRTRYEKWLKSPGKSDNVPLLTGGPIKIGGNEDPKDPTASNWKGWKTASTSSSVQAVALAPVPKGESSGPPEQGVYDPAPDIQEGPMLADVIGPMLSRPVRDLPGAPQMAVSPNGSEINRPRHGNLYDDMGRLFGTSTQKVFDPLVDFSGATPETVRTPDPIIQWQGQSIGSYLPPDTEGDVGDNYYLQATNVAFQIWQKNGTALSGYPKLTNTLWSGFGGPCQTDNDGDAIVLYDSYADRWVITQFAVTSGQAVCFAISQTSDPTGSYYLYQVNTQRFPDYFKIGIWPDPQNNAYFMGTNSGYQSQYDVYAIDRQRMLAGQTARSAQYFQNYVNLMMPADADGDILPPTGSPGYFYSFVDGGESYFGSPADDQLRVYAFHVDWNTPASSTMTLRTTVHEGTGAGQLASFNWTLCGFFTTCCLPQPGTTVKVDSASWWPMKRLQYRNLSEGREAMVGCWGVDVDGNGNREGVRWFELSKSDETPSGSWTLRQQGTHSPDATNRWMPSIAMDQSGNIALGYTAGNGTDVYPSIRYATRLSTDPLGTLSSEKTLWTGSSYQSSSSCRWGDYSSMNVDPSDDCTFWYTNEYLTASHTWTTRVGSFKLSECGCLAIPPSLSIAAGNNGNNRVDVTWPDSTTASITTYLVKRSDTSGGPYVQIAEVTDTSPGVGGSGSYLWSDTTVSGGSTYYYVVQANDGLACTSPVSNEVSVTATGICTLAPTFAGLTSVTNGAAATCTLSLSWSTGTSRCAGGTLTYNVYRDVSPGFTPGPANRIVSAVSGTSYQDLDQLVSGSTYYYIVRAVDAVNASEEANIVEKNGVPSGPGASTTTFTSTDIPKTILDNATVTSTVTVSDTNPISDVNVTITSLTHSYDADLDIYLLAPDGTTVELSTDNGAGGDNFTNTVFDDAAATSITAGTAPFTGTYKPEGSLATLNNKPANGTWTLRVADDASGDTGTLNGWSITISTRTACATGISCGNNPSAVDVTPNGPLALCLGTAQLLTATPSGGSGVSYQWYDGATPIPGATSSTYNANSNGTHSFNCQVKGTGCSSGLSDASNTTITWEAGPTFAGLQTVSNPGQSTCTLNLAWNAASTVCPGGVTYNIYRSTTPGFTPAPANRIALGVAGTNYTDNVGLVSATTYYYKVRAVANGIEESNVVERSAAPSGPGGGWTDTFEAAGGFDQAGWTHSPISGSMDWVWSTAHPQSGTHSWFSQSLGSASDRVIVTPSFSVAASTTLSFYHTYNFEGTTTCYDGGTLEITTNGGTTWTVMPDAAFTAGAFNGTVSASYSNPIGGKRAWCFGTIGTPALVTVNLGGTYSGTTAKLRWHEGDDSSSTGTGWYIDTVTINTPSACSTGVAAPPVVTYTGANAAKFTKGSGETINVTFDAASCSADKAVIVYNTIGNWTGYAGCAQPNGGSTGSTTINSTGQTAVWYNIVWTSGTTAGHPGFGWNGSTFTARTWTASGLCGMSADNSSRSTCP